LKETLIKVLVHGDIWKKGAALERVAEALRSSAVDPSTLKPPGEGG
jgi:hypothetical protein